MKHIFNSFRAKLLLIYLITITISALILTSMIVEYFTNTMLKQNTTLTQNTLTAMSQNINTYLDDLNRISILPFMDNDVLEAFNTYSNESKNTVDNYSLCEAKRIINTSFQVSLDNNRKEVNSILIIYPDGKSDYFNRISEVSVKTDYKFSEQNFYNEIIKADGSAVFIDSHKEEYLNNPPKEAVFSIGRLIKDPSSQKNLAVIVSNINNVALDNILNVGNFSDSSYIFIQDSKKELVYSPQQINSEIKNAVNNSSTDTVTIAKNKYSRLTKHINGTNWDIKVLLSHKNVENTNIVIKITVVVLTLFEIIFAFLLFCFWSHSITSKFSKIRNVMGIAKNGDLTARYSGKGSDEISQLGNDLNDMIVKINDSMNRERKAMTKMKSAEYKALQSQINPHFIFNVLNGFIGLNRLGMRDTLEKAIFSLSGMMRYILEHQEYAKLSEEFELISQYCNLQKIRFSDRFDAKINLCESVKDFKVPKLILQPLVENAIIHGIEPLNRHGELLICADEEAFDGKLFVRISVVDNGVGFNTDKIGDRSIGIKNIRERLNLTYKNAFLHIKSEIGKGTESVISIEMESQPADTQLTTKKEEF